MSITIYGIKNCSTMKKAFDKLTALGLEYEFFDYKKQAIDKTTLAHWVKRAGIDKVLNSKGTTYRKLSDAQKAQIKQDVDAALDMMVAKPSMIKRPIVVSNNELIIGFDETAFEKLGINVKKAELRRIASNPVELTEEQLEEVEKLIDKIEDDDDVQAVYTNIA